jgi:hypothetical protein
MKPINIALIVNLAWNQSFNKEINNQKAIIEQVAIQ